MVSTDFANAAFLNLDRWITENGWAGYDPYDIRGQDWYVRLFGGQHWTLKKLRSALALLEKALPPIAIRRLLHIRREINPKGMGLIASAYLVRSQMTGDLGYRQKAENVLRWLSTHCCTDYPGISWGYPFHWQSRIFLPRGTPSVVVTATVGDAWLQHYELTGSTESLRIAKQIAVFFQQALNRPVESPDHLCFSYTPIDTFKVHNASLFAAAFFARLGAIAQCADYGELAQKAARYTLSQQNADGSFNYWGSEPLSTVDHYHTGFVLRHLDTIRKNSSADFITSPLKRGYEFYLEQMFNDEGIPKFTPKSLYPIDIHSCAEAILCLLQLGAQFGGTARIATVFALTQEKMLTSNGWYLAAIRNKGGRESPVRVPYLRWGQAWMLLALARLNAALGDKDLTLQESRCGSE